ncbi:alginate lyase family protein [Paenibacillus filicis]|uniref:Alginate lyase family protein n=1 Tax=Paenibacillus gyeongsangnamensis TaxID=3388067 RepID=A0ABT4QBD2_9BACL|nr:alginate lyase family protein [Paenibacillus filicis]MCZ8514194.1 alginate lyase family protein [Paenibacillus filicis]
MDKSAVPPSGDKHDYMSMGPYWWPDPSKPDGKPYIQKDGQTNPERATDKFDATRFGKMASTVQSLALAYYFTGQEPYAVHAGKLLRTWFLNPGTRKNPNMNFGQSVPGRYDGRKEGVLDSRLILFTSDAAALLKGSSGWTKHDADGYRKWLSDYVKWLKTNPLALQEKNASNNHGTWYDAIICALMLHSGNAVEASAYLRETVPARLSKQLGADGSQPEEMKRTRSFHYPVFNLEAFSIIAL